MKIFDKLKRGITKFFYGRYGVDQLNIFILMISIILTYFKYGFYVAYAFLFIAIFRMLSKNIIKRRKEGAWFNEKIWFPIRKLYKSTKTRLTQRKDYRFFACPACKKTMRVPKKKGKVRLTCPNCQHKFIKKT